MTTPTPAQQLEPCPFCGYLMATPEDAAYQIAGFTRPQTAVWAVTCGAADCNGNVTAMSIDEVVAAWNRRTKNARALAALEAMEGWQVRVICVAVKDWDDAHRVEMQRINQTFRVGPDYWDTREEAEAYAEQLRVALGSPADAVEVSRG